MKAERVDTESSATEGSTSSSSYKTNSGPTLREAQLNARQRRLNAFEQRNSENRVPLPAEVPRIRKRGHDLRIYFAGADARQLRQNSCEKRDSEY